MILDEIRKKREQYMAITGKPPETIRISRDIMDQIEKEFREMHVNVYPEFDKGTATLFGMHVTVVDEED